jgi:hypothetical protein
MFTFGSTFDKKKHCAKKQVPQGIPRVKAADSQRKRRIQQKEASPPIFVQLNWKKP